ncbi:MAG: hypothetical protein QOF21_3306 [Actinomycetota bacterium]
MITYRDSVEAIAEPNLAGFFEGWPNPPSPATHLQLLRGSAALVVALDGDQVVGFVTAISDGVLSAYIPLLEVRALHRRQGIGGELVRRVVAQLEGLYMIDLSCDDDLVPFYEGLGFQRGAAMTKRNYAAQSGRA